MIGGSGPRKTMGIVARHADEWNKSWGTPEVVAESLAILRQRCAEASRDYSSIKKTVMVWLHVADGREDAIEAYQAVRVAAGFSPDNDNFAPAVPMTVGTIDEVAEDVRAYESVGVDELIVQLHEPYDRKTMELLPELRARLART
jgi:alkanesulfonate monooxygenase SsuD/methylene tetrahydromethanopterin reductase-like flavin-dependent oxidoreductase (luciferase family)